MRRIIICIVALAGGCAGPPDGGENAASSAPRISVTIAGPGTIVIPSLHSSCHGACSFKAEPGASVVLAAAADAEGTFAGWSGACFGMGTCEVVAGSDLNVAATFLPRR